MLVLFAYCSSRPSFSEQIRNDFANRVIKIDSSVKVDSFQLVRTDSLTEQIGQIIYDSMFAREEARLESELNSARMHGGDTSYKLEEITYMKKGIDSIGNLIVHADTVRKYGILSLYTYTISNKDKSKSGRVYYFISNEGRILNPDMIADSLKPVVAELK
jgi:hypothetical protein